MYFHDESILYTNESTGYWKTINKQFAQNLMVHRLLWAIRFWEQVEDYIPLFEAVHNSQNHRSKQLDTLLVNKLKFNGPK